MRISDWSSDVCSSDLWQRARRQLDRLGQVTGDDPGQQARIERLRTAYAERGAALSDTEHSTFYTKNSQALARFYKARASDSLNTDNRKLDEIVAHESKLLGDSTKEAAANNDREH